MTQRSRRGRPGVGRNFWMFVESAENFEVLRDMNFSLFGMGPRYRRRAERMKPEDRVLFYVKGLRKWPATATVASRYFEDDSPVWTPTTRNESFRYRIRLKANVVLDEEDYIDALLLAPRLEYVKRWVPEDWPLAFWDRLHLLPQTDFRLIEGEMQRLASRRAPRKVPRSAEVDQDGPPPISGVGQVRGQDDVAGTLEPSRAGEHDPEVVSYPATAPDEARDESPQPSTHVDDAEAQPEVVGYPAADPNAPVETPGIRSVRTDDTEVEPEVVSYPAADPNAPLETSGNRSVRADDTEIEPEVVSYPAADPNAPLETSGNRSVRADDTEDEPEVVSYPAADPNAPLETSGNRSVRADDTEDEPEVVSYPAADPNVPPETPGYRSTRADGAEEEPEIVSYPAADLNAPRETPGHRSVRADDGADEPEVVSYPAPDPNTPLETPGHRSVRADDGADEPEVVSYPAAEPDTDETQEEQPPEDG